MENDAEPYLLIKIEIFIWIKGSFLQFIKTDFWIAKILAWLTNIQTLLLYWHNQK